MLSSLSIGTISERLVVSRLTMPIRNCVIRRASNATNPNKLREMYEVALLNLIVSRSPTSKVVVRMEEATIDAASLETSVIKRTSTKSAIEIATRPIAVKSWRISG